MTPAQEKAKEILSKFSVLKTSNEAEPPNEKVWYFVPTPLVKQCALICVEEELKGLFELKDKLDDEIFGEAALVLIHQIGDLEEVKQEIEKI